MKLTVLVDNNTYIDQYYVGEPALSFYIENHEDKILFDLGYSDVYLKNAKLMGIDLTSVNQIVFSHGHNDHTGGLSFFPHRTNVIAHPYAFLEKVDGDESYGPFMSENEILERFDVTYTEEPFEISENLFFLSNIPMTNSFEKLKKMGLVNVKGTMMDDYTPDDSALVYHGEEGLHIITGCSHAGICNIIEYAKAVLKEDRIVSVIGGFHLFEYNHRLDETIAYFKANHIQQLYPCHCTSFQVKSAIHQEIEIHEVGVGLTLEFK